MATEELGETGSVNVRKVWLDEARDFTPWLAENLWLLGDTLGMQLELVQAEAASGRYNVDILADDARTSATVIIENQLEWTNHSHLGQLLVYAGWHDARTLIWIAPDFTHEHKSALDWLNRWTPEVIQVFGVELHTTKASGSNANLEFVPVVFPVSWSKGAESRPVPVKLQGVLLREFFQQLIDDLRKKRLTVEKKALTTRYHPFLLHGSSITFHACFETDGTAWVYISGGTANLNALRKDECRQTIFDELGLDADAVTSINWRVSGTGTLGVYRKASLYDEEQHDEIREWMFDYLLKFKDVFNWRMEKAIAELENSGK